MTLLTLIILGLIQGVTEFLPISSSAHLILFSNFFKPDAQGILIDISIHFGSILAVIVYFFADVKRLVKGFFSTLSRERNDDSALFLRVVVATIPIIIAGYAVYYLGYSEVIRNIEVIAWATLIFGIILYFADQHSLTLSKIDQISFKGYFFIGIAQALALIPGVSRSGIVLTAGRIVCLERAEAAILSILLSIPTILAASILGIFEIYQVGDSLLTINSIFSAAVSFIASSISIMILMFVTTHFTILPFVIYRTVLGLGLLIIIYVLPLVGN